MRIFIIVLVLIFNFQSWSKADDIRDFQIDGFSIGDSLLDFYSEKKINSEKLLVLRGGKKFKEYAKIVRQKDKKSDIYDGVLLYFKTDDKNYSITAISGRTWYEKNISKCYKDQKKIAQEVESSIEVSRKVNHPKRKTKQFPKGNSYVTQLGYFVTGGVIAVQCYDWSPKDTQSIDRLSITIYSKEYNDWLNATKF